jgi:hypothetical protein
MAVEDGVKLILTDRDSSGFNGATA